jgi:outer membrane protein TolC
MNTAQPKFTRQLLSAIAVLSFGVGALWFATTRSNADDAQDSKLNALLKERVATATLIEQEITQQYKSGRTNLADVIRATQTVNNARLDLCKTKEVRVALLEKNVAGAKELENYMTEIVKAGVATSTDALAAKIQRLEAEITLERAKLSN